MMTNKKDNNPKKPKLTPEQKKDAKKAIQALRLDSELPQSLLNQISEFSNSYILLHIDSNGSPVVNMNFSNDIEALALCKHMSRLAATLENIHDGIFLQNFQGEPPPEEQQNNS